MDNGFQTIVKANLISTPFFSPSRSTRLGYHPFTPSIEAVTALTDLCQESHFNHDFSRVPVRTATAMMIQPKLTINQPNDKYEQEADRATEQVMRMPEPCRQCQGQSEEEETLQTKPLSAQITPLVQRQAEPEEEEEEAIQAKLAGDRQVQRQAEEPEEEDKEESIQTKRNDAQIPQVKPGFETQIRALRGGGQLLPEPVRSFFEPRFGHDFSQVRVHTDRQAAETAQAVKARAYTVGKDMVFGPGQYAPDTNNGQRLLAHELTHVVQQGKSEKAARLSSQVNSQDNKGKRRIDQHAENYRHGSDRNIELTQNAPVIQRECPPPERLGRVAPPETCIPADPNTRVPDQFRLPLRFCFDSDDLIDSDAGNMAALRSRIGILTLGAGRSVHIHGYASLPGGRTYNRRLACYRAIAVKRMLGLRTINPIILHSHGATSVFGAQAENQRVVVATDPAPSPVRPSTPPPPPPPARASGPFLDRQIWCVIDRGGCSNPARIPWLDTLCRIDTQYSGVPVVAADLVCTTPGMGIARSLERAYPGWLGRLPNCPCTSQAAAAASNFSRDRNPFLWRYHPGAHVCYRSAPVASVPGTNHRQQCCYTRSGMLITQGSGAGTPDVWSSFFWHQRIDVGPFNQFNKDWRIYNRYWIPNRGSGCGVVSDPCINRCEQLFEACGAGLRCLAWRNRCLRQCRRRPPRRR